MSRDVSRLVKPANAEISDTEMSPSVRYIRLIANSSPVKLLMDSVCMRRASVKVSAWPPVTMEALCVIYRARWQSRHAGWGRGYRQPQPYASRRRCNQPQTYPIILLCLPLFRKQGLSSRPARMTLTVDPQPYAGAECGEIFSSSSCPTALPYLSHPPEASVIAISRKGHRRDDSSYVP